MKLKKENQKKESNTTKKSKIMELDFNYLAHANLVVDIANKIFEHPLDIDEHNRHVFRLLLHYFNNSKKFETLFEKEGYLLSKGIMLVGGVGTGKTSIMRVFKEYCNIIKLKSSNYIISDIREVSNYFRENGNIVKYTYGIPKNIYSRKKYFNYYFDDIGTEAINIKHYGSDVEVFSDLLKDRYILFSNHKIKTHLTTNLGINTFSERYDDRIASRMREMFNIIPVLGNDRRK